MNFACVFLAQCLYLINVTACSDMLVMAKSGFVTNNLSAMDTFSVLVHIQ